MTDFARDLFWDEEKPPPLPAAEAEAGRGVRRESGARTPVAERPAPPGLAERLQARAGNAALAAALTGKAPEKEPEPPGPDGPSQETAKAGAARAREEATRAPAPGETAPDSRERHAPQAEAPAAPKDADRRAALLAGTLAQLARRPGDAPLDPLFGAYREAPTREVEGAADALLALVLRAEAKLRPELGAALRPVLKAHGETLLARLLATRIGGFLAAPVPAPAAAPAPPADPGGGE